MPRVQAGARPRAVAFALAATFAGGGCRGFDAGLEPSPPLSAPAADAAPPDDAADPGPDGRASLPDGWWAVDAPERLWDPVQGLQGMPSVLGCADGTREGFLDARAWRDIAGCAGAWSVEGLQSAAARAPRCERAAGNSGRNAAGAGCSISDLCADGWHVCEDGDEVARSSPTGCESAADEDHAAFFVVRAGATGMGLCGPPPAGTNDLHGCGTFGRPESATCAPLSRRMGFADCDATRDVWHCGAPADFLDEGAHVAKTSSALGGALCCRDR